ncbi:MAG: hypothetical protein JW837_10250 [Sedimentisphaerales bacterium]|nr:hypothetical protein [Sedimentisphaerales bacterium]
MRLTIFVIILMLLLSISQVGIGALPANDDVENAESIGNVTDLTFDTTEATIDGPEGCMTSANIWYCYTATCTGSATISLCGSEFDTKLAVYYGCSSSPSSSDMIQCSDDFCDRQSEVVVPVISGNKYLIEVGGYNILESGSGVLNISCDDDPAYTPSNDDWFNSYSIGNVINLEFDTTHATFDGPGGAMTGPNIWFCYTAEQTCSVTVSLCGSDYDTKLAVYEDCGTFPSHDTSIDSNDDFCGRQSQVTFSVVKDRDYLIEVGGFGDHVGDGVISIWCGSMKPVVPDLGDAPDSTNNFWRNMTAYPKGGPSGVKAHFPTVYDDGSSTGPVGPIHLNSLAVAHLGKMISDENEADTGIDQDVLNNIKPQTNSSDNDKYDDGILFPVNMPKCRWTTFNYDVNVIKPGTNLWVNVWCDWNRDGDWDDDSSTNPVLACSKGMVSEWTVQNQYLINLPAGLNQITTPAFLSWHPYNATGEIWMRITLSEKPWTGGSAPGYRGNGGSGPHGGYEIGETEDYYFLPGEDFTICEDYNDDGLINNDDLSDFTSDWLDNCP